MQVVYSNSWLVILLALLFYRLKNIRSCNIIKIRQVQRGFMKGQKRAREEEIGHYEN